MSPIAMQGLPCPNFMELGNMMYLMMICLLNFNDFDDCEDYVLYITYDALDDGSILLDNTPCIKIATSTCEDKNDTLAICEDILIHESSILLLNSPNHTIRRNVLVSKNSYVVWKYLMLMKNPCYNHDTVIDNGISHYLKRGEHHIDCHDNSNVLFMSKYVL
jgi:hypothetical protein